MALAMKIKHIVTLKNGSLKFRRRLPADIFAATGKRFFEVTMRNSDTSTVAFLKEYSLLMREWQGLVDSYKASAKATERTPQQRYNDALKKRADLLNGVVGLSEEDAAAVIIENHGDQMDDLTRRVLADPVGAKPEFTLTDAKAKYVEDKGIATNIKKMQRLDRAFKLFEEVSGDPAELALVDLRKAHGQAWLDALKGYRQVTGQPYLVETMRRMTNDLKAIVNHPITFVDFDQPITNPFMRLPFPKEAQIKAVDKTKPMPDAVMDAVTERLDQRARIPELTTLWRILTVTGCRLSEVGFTQMKDIDLDGSETGGIPVVHIRPNEFRGIKDLATMRTLPLTGRGLQAAREHVAKRLAEGATPGDAVFPAYAKVKGNENATSSAASNLSATLMKHIKAITDDEKIVVHSLRHRLLDKLRDAGASEATRDPFAGHSSKSTGDRVYGSVEARVRELNTWALKANP